MPLSPATMTVQNVLDATKRLFGDESGAQLTDTDIIRWINEGQLEIARKNKYNRTTTTTPTVINQANYSLAGVNIMSIETLTYNDYPVENQSFEQVQEAYLKNYAAVQLPSNVGGTPLVWYEYGDSIYLWPPPTVAGDVIKLFVCTYPTKLTSATDSLSIPDIYYDSLLSFVRSRAYEMDDDLQSSQVILSRYKESTDAIASVAKGIDNSSYPSITVLMDDA